MPGSSLRAIARLCLNIKGTLDIRGEFVRQDSSPPISLNQEVRFIRRTRCRFEDPVRRGKHHVGQRQLQIAAEGISDALDAVAYYPADEDGDDVPVASGAHGPPFPLIVYAHGNRDFPACPGTPADTSGDFRQLSTILGHLVSWGYIAVSADGSSIPLEMLKAEIFGACIAHMRLASANPVSPFHNTVGAETVLLGHSTGAGAALAAAAGRRFEVTAVGLIAPSTQINEVAVDVQAPILILQGTEEGAAGTGGAGPDDPAQRIFNRANPPKYLMRIQGANHFGFTDELCVDPGDPVATISRVVQQQITFAYLISFVQRHVRGFLAHDPFLVGDVSMLGLEGFAVVISSDA